jgi:hypothetical protein
MAPQNVLTDVEEMLIGKEPQMQCYIDVVEHVLIGKAPQMQRYTSLH